MSRAIDVLLILFLIGTTVVAAKFPDVPDNYWAAHEIGQLSDQGVLMGYPDGTFRPDETINRAQLAAIVARLKVPAAVQTVTGTQFADVPSDYWGYGYIGAAADADFVRGYPDKTFQPTIPIDRVDAVVMIVRFAGLPAHYKFTQYYQDVTPEHWAVAEISAAKEAGFLDFIKEKDFEPARLLTRAEACWMLVRALKK